MLSVWPGEKWWGVAWGLFSGFLLHPQLSLVPAFLHLRAFLSKCLPPASAVDCYCLLFGSVQLGTKGGSWFSQSSTSVKQSLFIWALGKGHFSVPPSIPMATTPLLVFDTLRAVLSSLLPWPSIILWASGNHEEEFAMTMTSLYE